jgi:hypothetical protein
LEMESPGLLRTDEPGGYGIILAGPDQILVHLRDLAVNCGQ